MGKMSDQTWKVIQAFQKYTKGDDSAIENFSAADIRRADEELGWRDKDSGWRLSMENRIDDLLRAEEKEENRKEQSHVRAWQVVVGIFAALLVAAISAWLF